MPRRSGSRELLDDVLAYRDRMDERAEAALTALTMEAEALGLYGE